MEKFRQKNKNIWVFYLMLSVLLLFTASLDFEFVKLILGSSLYAAFSLVLFDGASFGWLFIYLNVSEGEKQNRISRGMVYFSLVGIGLLTAGKILYDGREYFGVSLDLESLPALGTTILVIWTLVNIWMFFKFEIENPENQRKEELKVLQNAVFGDVLAELQQVTPEISKKLTKVIAPEMIAQFSAEILEQNLGKDKNFEYEIKRRPLGYEEAEAAKRRRQKKNRDARKAKEREEARLKEQQDTKYEKGRPEADIPW